MKIKARFIGTDGSMGLKKGKLYQLEVHATDLTTALFGGVRITASMVAENWKCPYKDIETFLDNWAEVSKI